MTRSLESVLLLLMTLRFTNQGKITSEKDGLYSSDDDVYILTDANFGDLVYGSTAAWVVEFYNSWCGHCIRYAPEYKNIATNVKGWQSVIKIGAIDCATDGNRRVCSEFDIKGYPTLVNFKPLTKNNDSGELIENRDKDSLTKFMTEYVSDIEIQRIEWPNLQPLRSVEHVWNEHKPVHKYVALVFEEEDSVIGRQVILDVSQYQNILVRRALKPLMKKFGIKKYPSLYLLHQDGRYEQLARDEYTREGFTNALRHILGLPAIENVEYKNVESTEEQKDVTLKFSKDGGINMQDLESTLTYILRQEVAIHRSITGESFNALKKFIYILSKYFPGREEVKTYLVKLYKWLSEYQGDMSGLHWLHSINDLQTVDMFIPETVKWIGCQGSEKQYRGYPCGLWTLFHVLTVSEYNYMTKHKRTSSPVTETLDAVTGYMQHFFGCEECSENFLKMSKTIETEVTSHGDQILWLWKAHNEANKRLHGDLSEDPKHIKMQFPSKKLMCDKCHTHSSTEENPVWELDKVLVFLRKYYSSKKIVPIPEEAEDFINRDFKEGIAENHQGLKKREDLDWWELKQRQRDMDKIKHLREKKHEERHLKIKSSRFEYNQNNYGGVMDESFEETEIKYSPGSHFTQIDIGMCIMFYVMCTVIVLLLYYHFSVRKLNSRCKMIK